MSGNKETGRALQKNKKCLNGSDGSSRVKITEPPQTSVFIQVLQCLYIFMVKSLQGNICLLN